MCYPQPSHLVLGVSLKGTRTRAKVCVERGAWIVEMFRQLTKNQGACHMEGAILTPVHLLMLCCLLS